MARTRPAEVVVHVEPRFQASLAVAFAAPRRGAADEAAFVILERILGRMFSSRLNLAIREGEGHSYGAYAVYAPMQHDGLLTVTTAVADPQAVRTAELIFAEIGRMQQSPPSEQELTAAKATARQSLRAELERTPSLAAALAELFVGDMGPERWTAFDAQLAAVDGVAVMAVARRYLAQRSPIVVVGSSDVLEAFARSRLDVAFGEQARRRPWP